MPKPLFGDNGSGMHTHQSLWNDGTNLFYDPDGYALLSDTARHYIGGLLKHAKAVLAFAAPTTNSYRRLVPGYEAPINLVYSPAQPVGLHPDPDLLHDARRAPARVPLAGPDVQPVPLVLRPADGRARRRHQQDRAAGSGRQGHLRAARRGEAGHRRNARARSRRRSTRSRPTTTSCYRGDVFTPDVVETHLAFKRDSAKQVALRPHPYEFYLYSEL